MRSQYVPRNIKQQLLAAIRECERDCGDDVIKISSIADMGLFIDASCNEIVYYHSITSSLLQWTLSLYVHDVHVKNVIKTVLDDMGRIGDEDIQFILEKYRYNEERRLAGDPLDRTGVDRMLSFLKPQKFKPDVSYFSYYTHTVMLKLARSVIQNSAAFLNSRSDVFCSSEESSRSPDAENDRLYSDYKRHRERLATVYESESLGKMRRLLKSETLNGDELPVKEPPETIDTVFDQPYSSDEESEVTTPVERIVDDANNVDSYVDTEGETKGYTVDSPTLPPPTLEDLEVAEIMKGVEPVGRSPPPQHRVVGDASGIVATATRELRERDNRTDVRTYEDEDVDLMRSDLQESTRASYMDAFLSGATESDSSSAVVSSRFTREQEDRCTGFTNVSDELLRTQRATSYIERVADRDSDKTTTTTTTVRRLVLSRELRGLLRKGRVPTTVRRNPITTVSLRRDHRGSRDRSKRDRYE